MKSCILIIGILIISFNVYSDPSSILNINDTLHKNSLFLHLSFISNRPISEDKFLQLRKRFKNTFPEFKEMSITYETQTVIVIFVKGVNQETINKVISYFEPESFETY